MKKLSVTIGICAYNEEANIGRLLTALQKQTEHTIRIAEILVYSDGSTDGTVANARQVHDSRIRVIDDPVRKGKAYRLNTLFVEGRGDVIVLFDADSVPTENDSLEYICQPFHDPSFRGLAGGRRRAIPSHSLTAIAMANVFHSFDIVREKLHGGKNLYSFLAGITALHRDFARSLILPLDSPCDDNHIYLEAKRRGLPLAYVPKAIVWFSPPQTMADQIAQWSRYLASEAILSRYFDPAFIRQEFFVPRSLRLQVAWYHLRHNPIAWVWSKCLALICSLKSRQIAKQQGGTWRIIPSTKSTI